MSALLEDLLAELNKNVFYREFSFSTNEFTLAPGETKEFADHVVWIDDLLVIYQLKQRVPRGVITEESERKWFKREVVNKATRQIRDTLRFLEQHPEISITNQRGHVFNVSGASLKHFVKLVVYEASASLPTDCLDIRHHLSRTGGGFIHILPWADYLGICQTLITPAEVNEYLTFRERVIGSWGTELPSEPALVGQFLSGDDQARPGEQYVELLKRLKRNSADFDIFFLLDGVADRIEHWEGPGSVLDYYKIIAEFAKLNRLELKEVKKRVVMCLEAVTEDRFLAPMRVIANTGCGFAFIPLERALVEEAARGRTPWEGRMVGLRNLTLGAKYDWSLDRQIGVSFAMEGSDRLIDWCSIDSPWRYDSVMEEWVNRSNPFLPLRYEVRERYEFEGDAPQG